MRPITRLTPLLTNLKPYINQNTSECPFDFEHGPAFQPADQTAEPVHAEYAGMHWAYTWLPVPEDAAAGCPYHRQTLVPFGHAQSSLFVSRLDAECDSPGQFEVLFGL